MLIDRIQADDDHSSLLKNVYYKEPVKECDPMSEDPDVGILSCGSDLHCYETADSKLGGVCLPIAHARKLSASGSVTLSSCTNTTGNLNVTNFTGSISCDVQSYQCPCSDYCFSSTATFRFLSGTDQSNTVCLYFKKPYAANVCYSYIFSTKACAYSINGTDCTSCVPSSSFDCTNVPKGSKGSQRTTPKLQGFQVCYVSAAGNRGIRKATVALAMLGCFLLGHFLLF